MSDTGPELSVIVVNHNGMPFLPRCLEAVLSQDVQGGFEVVVVDNASSDGSLELVRSRYPAVNVLSLPANTGFAGGNNLGIQAARGRFYVLVNTDAFLRRGCLAALRAA